MDCGIVLCKIAEEIYVDGEDLEDPAIFQLLNKYWKVLPILQNFDFEKFAMVNRNSLIAFVEEKNSEGRSQLKMLFRRMHLTIAAEMEQYSLAQELFVAIFKNYVSHLDVCKIQFDELGSGGRQQTLMKKYVTTKLYDALFDEHTKAIGNGNADQVLPEELTQLRPALRPYQKRTVSWLLKREQEVLRFPAFYVHLFAQDNEHSLYAHTFHLHVQSEPPPLIELPPGGILADEMGLGKTVEMLALIVSNPRNVTKGFGGNLRVETETLPKRARTLFCICTKRSFKNVVQCTNCTLSQHVSCVASHNKEHEDAINEPYLCPGCWHDATTGALIETRATFIVSPNTIKLQWLAEIKRHTDPMLRVLVYDGVDSGHWISPRQLADYDVVLTDYNILRRELYHTAQFDTHRVTRNQPRSMRVHSPLLMLQWWRVCTDEAQMIESNNRAAALVRLLPAVNRWAVTGTPIQNSIDDLHPLLGFLGFREICEPMAVWNNLVLDFLRSHNTPRAHPPALVELLQKCMWRTCKSKVIDELQIPPQSEVIHRIFLSNLEKLYYEEEHALCESKFNETVSKCIERKQDLLSISPRDMKIVLQPLLRIRQCCTIPVVITSRQLNVAHKQFLQPRELHKHLKSINENECKAELRSMASSYNGIAGIFFLQENYDEAIRYYKCVLKLADDYKEVNISVDSLLQIHALYNILEAYAISPAEKNHQSSADIEMYEQSCIALEWKYLESYASQLSSMRASFLSARDSLARIQSQTDCPMLQFMAEIAEAVLDNQQLHEALVCKVTDEVRLCFSGNVKVQEIQSIHGMLYTINEWHENIADVQRDLEKEFQDVSFFVENVRARNQVEESTWRQIIQFTSSVYECHLSDIRVDDKKSGSAKRKSTKKTHCKLCKMRQSLNKLECLLFDKVIAKENDQTEGLENPSMEIVLIKAILNFMKSRYVNGRVTFVRDIEKQCEALEVMQSICKKWVKFWIEIDYTVKAYDELDMCKMRISLTDADDQKSNYKISEFEIDRMMLEQKTNLYEAQRTFALKLARLNYIKHLEADAEPERCPICRSEDEAKYAVLECGHSLCLPCLKSLSTHSHHNKVQCPVCRNRQNTEKVYYVTRDQASSLDDEIEIKGHYSSKITYIVRLILKLKREHSIAAPGPKILIFSQWTDILKAIAVGLQENGVRHRLQTSPQTIEDFKNPELQICCLLMPFAKGSKGLNLTEATHVFLVEPILNPAEELQAIGRIHRFGQTQATTVHRFIVNHTIEDNVFNAVTTGKQSKGNWELNDMTLDGLRDLFKLKNQDAVL